MKIKVKISEEFYWYVKRPLHSLFLFTIWHLPKKVVYWCVVRAATKVKTADGSGTLNVTADQMMREFGPYDER